MEEERGFTSQDTVTKCLLLGEELGELFRAVRRAEGVLVAEGSPAAEVGHELADVLIYLCAIANRQGVDLEEAFRAKEAINDGRRWK